MPHLDNRQQCVLAHTLRKSTRVVARGMALDRAVQRRPDTLPMAFDRRSVRVYDQDGRLHVEIANISKATVNPYIGSEIPDWQRLGLEADKLYYLYRDPEELKKAAPTFNGLPVLSEHQPVTADTHDHKLTIGATGTDAVFQYPYLRNSLVIWPEGDIKEVQNDTKRQLSCGYRYTADMTPGESPEGEKYDGVMRDIIGNHVALVKEGRAGADVVVGDSRAKVKGSEMSKTMTRQAAAAIGVVAPYVRGLLAQDQAIDLRPVFRGISASTWENDKPRILRGVQKLTQGKLAQDEDIGKLAEMLDMLEAHGGGDESVSKPQHNAMEAAAHGKSTLGIPKHVGEEFAKADKGKTFDRKEAHDEEDDMGDLHSELHKHLSNKLTADDLDHVHSLIDKHGKGEARDEGPEDEPEMADLDHEEEEEDDREADRGVGEEESSEGMDEDSPNDGEKLHELGAAGDEGPEPDSTSKQEDRDTSYEWRRGSNKAKPATDRKRARDAKRRGHDEPPPFPGRPRPGGGMDRRHGMDSKQRVTMSMDEINATVSKAVAEARKAERAISVAREYVRPWTGDLPVSMSFDSADAVYAHALKCRGVDTKGIHPSAFKTLLSHVEKPGDTGFGNVVRFDGAQDSKGRENYTSRFPEAQRIRRL
jgi:hypothetical protein